MLSAISAAADHSESTTLLVAKVSLRLTEPAWPGNERPGGESRYIRVWLSDNQIQATVTRILRPGPPHASVAESILMRYWLLGCGAGRPSPDRLGPSDEQCYTSGSAHLRRQAAFTSMADSDPRHCKARASDPGCPGRPHSDKLSRICTIHSKDEQRKQRYINRHKK